MITPLVVVILTLAQVVKGATGFGSALVAMPLLTLARSPHEALALCATADLIAGMSLAPGQARAVPLRPLVPVLLATWTGQVIGVSILTLLDPGWLRLGIAALVFVMAVRVARSPAPDAEIRPEPAVWAGPLAGLGGGLLGGLVGMGGPPIVAWATRSFSPDRARATLIVLFATSSLVQLAALWSHGLWAPRLDLLALVPVVLIGNRIGLSLHRALGPARFRPAVATLLFLSSLSVGLTR